MKVLQIEKIMQIKEVTPAELARRMGVERQTVHYYIRQDDKLPVSKVREIAEKLEVSLFDLIGDEAKEVPELMVKYQGETKRITETDLIKLFKEK